MFKRKDEQLSSEAMISITAELCTYTHLPYSTLLSDMTKYQQEQTSNNDNYINFRKSKIKFPTPDIQ